VRGSEGKLNRKQEVAVMALLTEQTLRDAAKKAGVSEATLYRWQQLEGFKSMFRDAKRQAVGQATARLQQSSTLAIETLNEVMQNKKAPAMARVTAAKTVLEFSYKAYEIEELQERVERLEESLKENAS
jgi:DNA-binding MurR/RpiR family transcriptional regulator